MQLIRKGDHVAVTFLADIGFLNKNVPIHYRGAPVFVIMLVETSDGRKVHFCRTRYVDQVRYLRVDADFFPKRAEARESVNYSILCRIDKCYAVYQLLRYV